MGMNTAKHMERRMKKSAGMNMSKKTGRNTCWTPSTKIDLGATGDRLMTVGGMLMKTGFPPTVTVGKVLAVLGFFTWVSGELFD